MHHFILIMLTFVNGQPIQHQEKATFDDFATCNRVAMALRSVDPSTGLVTSPYCMGRP